MPVSPSAIARLCPARRRRRSRTLVTRVGPRVIVIPDVPAPRRSCSERVWSGAWTLYSRWAWRAAAARTERTRRTAHPDLR